MLIGIPGVRKGRREFLSKQVTVQYLHSYDAKFIGDHLWRWNFALLNHVLTASAASASACTEQLPKRYNREGETISMKKGKLKSGAYLGFMFALPAMIYMLVFIGYPMIQNLILSLKNVDVYTFADSSKPVSYTHLTLPTK